MRKERSGGICFTTEHIVIIVSHKLVLAVVPWRLAGHIFTMSELIIAVAVFIFPNGVLFFRNRQKVSQN